MGSSFDFTMTMPGDARLVGAVRDLAAHAARYAQLPQDAADSLVEQAARAAATNIEAANGENAPVEVRLSGDVHRLQIRIASEVPAARAVPASSAAPGVTIGWSRVGPHQVCVIVHVASS